MSVNLIDSKAISAKLGGRSRTTIWRYRKGDSKFPKPVDLGGAQDLWIEEEIDDYILSKAAERDMPSQEA